jgi:hypothetical protein
MDRVSQIEELSKRHDQMDAGSIISALVRCLSFDESLEACRRSLEGASAIRTASLRRVCSDIRHAHTNGSGFITELKGKILSGAPRRRAGYAYCLLEIARASDRSVKNDIQAFLCSSKYVGLRRRGYKLYEPDCPHSRETLDRAWREFRDPEAAWLMVKGHAPVDLQREKSDLISVLSEGWQLSRLYLKLAELDEAQVSDLLELDPITYVYVCVKLRRPVPHDQLTAILEDSLGDERLGLLLWCLGELRHWDLIMAVSRRSEEITTLRFARSG